MTDIKEGDRVRVAFEGTVYMGANLETGRCRVVSDTDSLAAWVNPADMEKIEPPVEVFKPGDLVRGRRTGRLFALGNDGYVIVGIGAYVPWDTRSRLTIDDFTSAHFEKVII